MPIFGRWLLSGALSSPDERTAKLGLDLCKLFNSSLNLRPLEPIPRRQEPIATRVEQHSSDRHRGVVEGGQGIAGRYLRQDEKYRDEGDPDDRDPADRSAPPPKVPRTSLESSAGQPAEKDRDPVGDVQADDGDGHDRGVRGGIPEVGQSEDERADGREPD